MATLADELQADFLDLESDEENEDQEQDNDEDNLNGKDSGDTAMDEDDAEDEEGGDQQDKVNRALDEAEDQDEAKSRIDKINLKGVSDFKSVATLWKSLSPVLEVRTTPKHALSNHDSQL
jgi:U4/U6 small nuclear ribonucleoprotein PRP31